MTPSKVCSQAWELEFKFQFDIRNKALQVCVKPLFCPSLISFLSFSLKNSFCHEVGECHFHALNINLTCFKCCVSDTLPRIYIFSFLLLHNILFLRFINVSVARIHSFEMLCHDHLFFHFLISELGNCVQFFTYRKNDAGDFPGSPVVMTSPPSAGEEALIHGWDRSNIVTSSMKT